MIAAGLMERDRRWLSMPVQVGCANYPPATFIAAVHSVGLCSIDADAIVGLRATPDQFRSARGAMERAVEALVAAEPMGHG